MLRRRADAAQPGDRRLARALFALSLRGAALRPPLGRAGRGDQGRRIQQSRQAADAADRPQQRRRHAAERHFHRDGRQVGHAPFPRPPREASSSPPTIPKRSSSASSKGRLVQQSPKFPTPRTLAFDSYDLPINLPAGDRFRQRGNEQEELTLPEVARLWRSSGKDREDPARGLGQLELPAGRSGDDADAAVARGRARGAAQAKQFSSLGIFLAIVMVVTYHKINQYAAQMGAQGQLDPILALVAAVPGVRRR